MILGGSVDGQHDLDWWNNAPTLQIGLQILLCALVPIHIFWFYLILRVLQKALVGGTVQKDERSDSESGPDSGADDNTDGASKKTN